ncbi:hypothetical protein BDN70DRAFT_877644 [Pholiota conissans]|uniref:Uncharacterized protein n=1 Tax=Pholiota conissans TaxID=109636 RepID=A0A9P6D1H2_9AGAR|nr:hypothetical protein BDN70DRAFT_877644 [Pholiota conissans]
MGQKRAFDELLAEKDDKIAALENRILGYVGRLSVFQSRLLATLDTLDVIQNNQAQERADAVRNQASMQARLDEYIKVVREAELERDDMRDAVLKLVEKVEASNDYSSWPHSGIQLSSLADPIAHPQSARTPDDKELLTHTSVLIEALRRERDNERKAHAQTRETAEVRILALEAKIARRETELEMCIANAEHGEAVKETKAITQRAKTKLVDFETSYEDDEIISVLDHSVARNKVLEGEISTLYRRLENARAVASESPSDNRTPRPNSKNIPEPKLKIASHLDRSTSSTLDIVSPLESDHGDQRPVNAIHERSFTDSDRDVLKDLERQIKLLSDKIDSFADERNIILQTIALNHPVEPPDWQSNEQLETRLRILEKECLGLKASENALRDELEETREQANAREDELLDAIKDLRLALAANPLTLRPESSPHQTASPRDLLDPMSDGEMSMELATPLLPSRSIRSASPAGLDPSAAASSSSNPAEPSHEGDYQFSSPRPPSPPPSVPFVAFPASHEDVVDDERVDAANDDGGDTESDHDSEPTISHIVIPMVGTEGSMHFYRATSSFVAELRQVESGIAGAQVQLDAGETALDRIEDLVHDLHPP